jgi:hypothetical protein
MVFIIIGIVTILAGGALLYFRSRTNNELLEVRATTVSPASEIMELHQSIFDQIGPGGFSQLSEVTGRVETAFPLRSELAEIECVWFSSRVEERYEERYTETDSNGTKRERTRTAKETISSTTRSTPFQVRDASGAIEVDPDGARIDGDVVLNRHEGFDNRSRDFTIGSFSFRPSVGRRVLGYEYHESAIPLGTEVYVIGDACDRIEGKLCVRKPTDTEKPFIVSVRSEDEIVSSLQRSATLKKWLGIGLILIGIATVVWRLFNPAA